MSGISFPTSVWSRQANLGPIVQRELEQRIYSQELARGYTDAAGNVVMFLVAYGPVQNYRLKSHLPEVCYSAAGFRVSAKSVNKVNYLQRCAAINRQSPGGRKRGAL